MCPWARHHLPSSSSGGVLEPSVTSDLPVEGADCIFVGLHFSPQTFLSRDLVTSPRFNTLRQGSCVILSSPLLVILVHPYRSMPASWVRWSAMSSSPLSVMRTHCPMFRVLSSCICLTIRLIPSSEM
ncbi:hypothetical protein EYF80_050616 [Liparis tanakae]|uniref:Uncharacterized protein n=1 Tax=Liparis tanakae TaxID=230148 RepID=A0A4Z2FDD4_9TELE|nr:hypothetical protein EYF80_050616 [Liparis tanakae]